VQKWGAGEDFRTTDWGWGSILETKGERRGKKYRVRGFWDGRTQIEKKKGQDRKN